MSKRTDAEKLTCLAAARGIELAEAALEDADDLQTYERRFFERTIVLHREFLARQRELEAKRG